MNKKFGLIGYPLSHSFSEKYFIEKFERENIPDCKYNLYPIEKIEQLSQLLADNPELCGLNVTIPYKESIIPFLDELDENAKAVGAVNCIKIVKDTETKASRLIGFNTDIFGFKQSIKPFLETQHHRALILGAGGGAKAVSFVLKEIGIDCFFVTRSKRAGNVEDQQIENLFSYEELNENIVNAFKLIINASPVGMYPNINEAPALPYRFISHSHLLYDLIYNPNETEFLKRGKSKGASVVNGLSMLHQQAEEAWRIWNK